MQRLSYRVLSLAVLCLVGVLAYELRCGKA